MSKPTRKELARRLVLVEHEVDVLNGRMQAAQKVLVRLDPQQQTPPREAKRRPLVLRWFDQITGLFGCSWVVLAAVAAPAVAVTVGRWWL